MSVTYRVRGSFFSKEKGIVLGVFCALWCFPIFANAASETLFTADISYSLTLTKTGSGAGTITSIPLGIDCGSTCSSTFAEGTTITLTATPNTGSAFSGWSGDADCEDGTITLNGNVACSADFSLSYATPDLWTQMFGSTNVFHLIGNVGIGTNSPSKTLEVVGTIQTDELCLGTDCRSSWTTTSASTSEANLFETEPPENLLLPTNPQEITDENAFPNSLTEKILSLQGKLFFWKNDASQAHYGFLTKDVQQILPELVVQNSSGEDTVDYGAVVVALLERVKTRQEEIDTLRESIQSLEEQISSLEANTKKSGDRTRTK